jgi:hypothetical protein
MTSKERKALEASMGIALKKTLDEMKASGFSGRCWGIKGSSFNGSHVTFGKGNEIASVFVEDGKIRILEYRKTTGTFLGRRIRKIIETKNLPLAK